MDCSDELERESRNEGVGGTEENNENTEQGTVVGKGPVLTSRKSNRDKEKTKEKQ